MELIGIGRDVVAAHQSQIVQTGVQRASRGSESHGEACLHLSVLILQQGVGDGIFGIVEAVDRPLHLSRDDDVGNLRSVDHQRGLAPIVGCREAAHHSQSVALLSGVVERVLHITARLGIAIALAVVVARARIRRVVVLMSGLALLFAGCHKVDGACLQCLVGRLGLCHVAVGKVLSRLLIPVAHVAVVVNLIEGLQAERAPCVGIHPLATGIDGEGELRQVLCLNALQHISTTADEQRGRQQVLRRGHRAGRMVHAALAAVFVLQLFAAVGRVGAKQDGTIPEGHIVRVVGTFRVAQLHGQLHVDHVAHGPVALQFHIAGFPIGCLYVRFLSVHRHLISFSCPCRVTKGYGVLSALVDGNLGAWLKGEGRLLNNDEIGAFQARRSEEIHVERLVAVVRVDEMAVLGVVLHARTHTAPHGLIHLRVDAVALRTERGEVDIAARDGVLRGEDVVPRGILVEVGILGIGGAVAHHLRHLQHIVRVARFGTVQLVYVAVGVAGRQEMLVH